MPRYNRFCCYSAQTGTLIIGFLGYLAGAMSIYVDSYMLSGDHILKIQNSLKNQIEQQGQNASTSTQAWKKMDDMVGFDNVFIIGIVDSIVEVFVCGCLIYGVNEGKPFWMKPWLILRGITTFFLTIGAFAAFVTVACVSVGRGFLLLLFLIPIVTIYYLCWFVVQSVYLDTKEGKINGAHFFLCTLH